MEAVLSLKECNETSAPTCVVCLETAPRGKELVKGGEKSVRSLQNSAALRKLKFNPKITGAINRIQELDTTNVRYHSNCYATFTSTVMINRLPDINPNFRSVENNNVDNTAQANVAQTKWSECILCQEPQGRNSEHLRKISSENMQTKIRDLAEWDYNLKKRIDGSSNDLIAAKAMYHTNCLNKLDRQRMKDTNESAKAKSNNLALKEICAELYVAAEKGEVHFLLLL